MVKLKFIVKDGSLVLRISERKERYYKSVKHLLTGSPNLERHWNADKERFTCNAISYSDNNKAMEEFKSTYTKLLLEHPELTARQVASYFQPINHPHNYISREIFCLFLDFLAELMSLFGSGVNKFIQVTSIFTKELALFIVGNCLHL